MSLKNDMVWFFTRKSEKPPCTQDCPRRNGTCHATCEAFKAWQERCNGQERKIKEEKKKERDIRIERETAHCKSVQGIKEG